MKKIIFLIFIFIPLFNVIALDNSLAPNAKSAILIEANTGEIIYENNSHEKQAPASMTKIMSLLLIMEAIENDIISWNQMITVSSNASGMGGSQILLETGEKMSVENLVKGIAIASGNDAVVALAEAIAGTEDNFVKMMNDKAKKLGLNDTNFKNCHGLDEEGHYSSSYDMAYMSKELVKHKKILEFSSIYETYLRENTAKKIWLVNTNKLVRFKTGVDGLKTGYTSDAGYCLTATMQKDNMRVIATVMGEPDSVTRNNEVSGMLDYAFAQYSLNTLLSKNDVLKKISILKSRNSIIKVVPLNDIYVLNKKIDEKINPSYKIDLNEIKLPIKSGTSIGKVYVMNNNEVINETDLTVLEDVSKCNLFEFYFKNLKNVLSGNVTFF